MELIEVDNCNDCVFGMFYEHWDVSCTLKDIDFDGVKYLYKDKVHSECPLKDKSYKIKLK